jgi:hypothetical protein
VTVFDPLERDAGSCQRLLTWDCGQRQIRRIVIAPSFARPVEIRVCNIRCGKVLHEVYALRVVTLSKALAAVQRQGMSGSTDHPGEEHVSTAVHAIHPDALLFYPGE